MNRVSKEGKFVFKFPLIINLILNELFTLKCVHVVCSFNNNKRNLHIYFFSVIVAFGKAL